MKMLVLGAVGVLALEGLFVLGYLAWAASPAEGPLVRSGIQQVVLCGGKRERGNWLYKITEQVPGGDSGQWSTQKDGDCRVWLHYPDTGPAD